MPDQPGVRVSLETLPAAPQGVMHYEAAPVTHRPFERHGGWWIATHLAVHDGIGYLVMETRIRPMLLSPGAKAYIEVVVVEDRGRRVQVRFDEAPGCTEREVSRDIFRSLEEAPVEMS